MMLETGFAAVSFIRVKKGDPLMASATHIIGTDGVLYPMQQPLPSTDLHSGQWAVVA